MTKKQAWFSGVFTILMLLAGIGFMTLGFYWFGFIAAFVSGFYFTYLLWKLTELKILPLK